MINLIQIDELAVQPAATSGMCRISDHLAPVALEQVCVMVYPNHLGPKCSIIVHHIHCVDQNPLCVEIWILRPRDIHTYFNHHTEYMFEYVQNISDRRSLITLGHLATPMLDCSINPIYGIPIELIHLFPKGSIRVH